MGCVGLSAIPPHGWVPQGHASGVNLNALGIILAGFGQENNLLRFTRPSWLEFKIHRFTTCAICNMLLYYFTGYTYSNNIIAECCGCVQNVAKGVKYKI